jgi:hypothetical protein
LMQHMMRPQMAREDHMDIRAIPKKGFS